MARIKRLLDEFCAAVFPEDVEKQDRLFDALLEPGRIGPAQQRLQSVVELRRLVDRQLAETGEITLPPTSPAELQRLLARMVRDGVAGIRDEHEDRGGSGRER